MMRNPLVASDFFAIHPCDGAPERRILIDRAIDDPNSQLHQWLDRTEKWVEETFHIKRFLSSNIIRERVNTDPSRILNTVASYLVSLRTQGALAPEELEQILHAGNIDKPDGETLSPIERFASAVRMIEKMLLMNPAIVYNGLDRGQSAGR